MTEDSLLKTSLASQFRALLLTLNHAVERCPRELWLRGSGTSTRPFWKIAYHALFYTNFYLCADSERFARWSKHRPEADNLWSRKPKTAYTKAEILEYTALLMEEVGPLIEALDLSRSDNGFPWYPADMAKLEHVLLTLRHLGQHVGQLSELVMGEKRYVKWVSRG